MMKRLFATILATAFCIVAQGATTQPHSAASTPGTFGERELTVVASDGTAMGATLTTPADGKRPKATVVLATGSGTQNRDEEVFGKKPFKTLAEYLSANGYAVLRVDDRGIGNPADAAKATVDTYISDVTAAVTVADSLFACTPTGIIGHSAGGTYAIVNAVRNPQVDFIVTLAAPAWSGDSIIMSQGRAMAVAMTGRYDNEPLQRLLMDIVKSDMPDFAARIALTQTLNASLGDVASLPEARKQISSQIEALITPSYRTMVRYNPAADISAVDVPWLALNGSKDTQVLPGNLDTIRQLNPKASTVLLDGHNHLFQPCTTGLVQEYATIPGDISPLTLETILDWLSDTIR